MVVLQKLLVLHGRLQKPHGQLRIPQGQLQKLHSTAVVKSTQNTIFIYIDAPGAGPTEVACQAVPVLAAALLARPLRLPKL